MWQIGIGATEAAFLLGLVAVTFFSWQRHRWVFGATAWWAVSTAITPPDLLSTLLVALLLLIAFFSGILVRAAGVR